MLMLYLFPLAVLGAFVAVVADAVRFRSLLEVRAGVGLVLGGLVASYGLALVLLALNPTFEHNNSVSRMNVREIFVWALEIAGWLALVIVPAAFGLWSLLRAWERRRHERGDASALRRMGEGFEPHVNEIGGRLYYSQLVGFGPSEVEFRFPIRQRDLAVLLDEPWRRAVLEVAGHYMLQHSTMPGRIRMTEADFRRVVRAVLHSTPEQLQRFITRVGRDYNVDVMFFASEAMARRTAPSSTDKRAASCTET
ncbi:hypothetical protein GTW25_16170 [Aliihoeflea aestuarii]|uniref:hypothetical protein n=1 Tax=Aliihoeflea aestuarii TaxID=453840 RepID=UPI002094BA35|nr:hypothetical protein [Aliihoeflea aestuarii]MCO6392562.1 hypothetical protein [Aliihoeflea aestuarii]